MGGKGAQVRVRRRGRVHSRRHAYVGGDEAGEGSNVGKDAHLERDKNELAKWDRDIGGVEGGGEREASRLLRRDPPGVCDSAAWRQASTTVCASTLQLPPQSEPRTPNLGGRALRLHTTSNDHPPPHIPSRTLQSSRSQAPFFRHSPPRTRAEHEQPSQTTHACSLLPHLIHARDHPIDDLPPKRPIHDRLVLDLELGLPLDDPPAPDVVVDDLDHGDDVPQPPRARSFDFLVKEVLEVGGEGRGEVGRVQGERF